MTSTGNTPAVATRLREIANTLEGEGGFHMQQDAEVAAYSVRKAADMLSALTAQQTATAGWRLVPVEPTEAMVAAFWATFDGASDGQEVRSSIAAMLAAAPQQTATAVSREEIARAVREIGQSIAGDHQQRVAVNPWMVADKVLSLLSGGEGLARAEAGR